MPLPVKGAPRHYGIKTRTHFAAYQHKLSETETDVEGIQWATEQIRWLIQKGDVIHPHKATVAKYECHWSMKTSVFESATSRRNRDTGVVTSNDVIRDVVFVATEKEEAPSRYAEIDSGTILYSPDDNAVTLYMMN